MLESRGSKEVRLDMRGLQRIDLAAHQEVPLRLWRLRVPHFPNFKATGCPVVLLYLTAYLMNRGWSAV